MWRTEWRAVSVRIDRLLNAGDFFVRFQSIEASDSYHAAAKDLLPAAKVIFEHIRNFREKYGSTLPPRAVEVLDGHLDGSAQIFADDVAPGAANVRSMSLVRLTRLASIRSDLDYCFSDSSASARRLSERAFVHLRRSIVADPEVRRRWQEAFESGERACEKLGANHLLLHGIWAFKANSEGERTDLIFPDRSVDLEEVERSAEALVLTEWKVVKSNGDLAAQSKQAHKQASRYSVGSLAGLELVQYRYLVLVSKDFLAMPPVVDEGDVRYEYINIAVDPKTPSES